MNVEEAVAFLKKNGSAIRDSCTSAAIPEILTRCREKGLLSLEEKEICDNSNLTNAGKWDRISDMLQRKREITLDDVWEIFSGESSKHIFTYLRSVHTRMNIPKAGSSNQISETGWNLSDEKVSGNAIRGIQSQELTSQQNLSKIKIKDSEFILNGENLVAILNFAKENYTVKKLECLNISTRRVPQILKIFKSIDTFKFWHKRSISGDCRYLESRSDAKKEDDCLFKIEDLTGFLNLKNLDLRNIKVAFPGTFFSLLGLKTLFLHLCDISGDFIGFICQSYLEGLELFGNIPYLAKEDVEKLLRNKTLKSLELGKHYREIFATCFIPIGPDGKSMEKITPNTQIVFQRESTEEAWVQTIEFLDIVDGSFNLTQNNVDLVINSPNVNNTVGWLSCSNISTRRIPDIQKKFKYIRRLEFWHNMDEEGKCLIFEPPKKSFLSVFERKKDSYLQADDCLIKMIGLKGFDDLHTLCLENVEVEFPKSFSISQNLPQLLTLEIIFSSVIGTFMDALTSPSNLEDLSLRGITPPLTKGDVEGLLRIKSLNFILLSKHKRGIFTSSFTPIGPDGNPMREITQNSGIEFSRASFGKPWAQYTFSVEQGEIHLNNKNIECILNFPFEKTSVTTLICTDIPTMRVPSILNKFKYIQKLKFQHILDKNNKCVYFGWMSNARRENICLFKIVDLGVFSNLKILILIGLDVSFPGTFVNLPELETLKLQHCDIFGDFINDFICKLNLQVLALWGITPQLKQEDVEKLLRKNSLKGIRLVKSNNREIFTSSFTPNEPNGNQMQEIVQNADIIFYRDSSDEPWAQKVEEIKD